MRNERDQNDALRRQMQGELDRLRSNPSQTGLPPQQNIGIAPYPSQVAAGVGDSTDEALLNKLTELEGYINNNNPMRG